jgi:hypothetical protein
MDDMTNVLHVLPMPDVEEEQISSSGLSTPRGFANPDVLKAAQETKAANRAAREPQSIIPGEEPAPSNGKRGRKPKSERSLKGLEQLLTSIHWMVSLATGLEDLAITDVEAHTLAEAGAELASYYKIKMDGKNGALLGMMMAIGAVYGPRAVTIGIKLRGQKGKSNVGKPVNH